MASDIDVPANTLTWTAIGLPGGVSIDPASGQISGVLARPGNNPATYTVLLAVGDGAGGSASTSFDWTVIPANRPPNAVADHFSLLEDTSLTLDVLGNDSDPDGDPLHIVGLTQPSEGTLTMDGNGTVVYTPPADFSGPVTATYSVADSEGDADTAQITILVEPVNDAPLGVDDVLTIDTYLPTVLPVLANDSDPDGDPLSIATASSPHVGDLEVASATVTFTAPDGWVGTTSFVYTVTDPDGLTDLVTVTLTVPEQTLASARNLAVALGSNALALATIAPPFAADAISLTAVESLNLLVGVFYQTLGAFQLPFVFLGLSLIVLIGLGGAGRVPIILAGRVREHWSVVLLDRETRLRVYTEPSTASSVIYNFNPTTESILSTGRATAAEGTTWMPVRTPRGDGWVNAFHLTEQVDLEMFTADTRPARLVRQFAERLRNGGDMSSLIAERGIVLALTGTPARLAPEQFVDLLDGDRLRRLPTVGGVLHAQEDFRVAVAEPFLHAYDATPTVTPDTPHSKRALIPAEVWNFRYLALGEGTAQPWLVFFEYENGRPKIVGLGIDE